MTKEVVETGPCWWLIEGPRDEFGSPTERQCAAAARYYDDGSFDCDAGHSMGSMVQELGPGGLEWQRELQERQSEGAW